MGTPRHVRHGPPRRRSVAGGRGPRNGDGGPFGNGLTDLDNDGLEDLYFAPDDLAGFDAIFFSSDEPGFQGGEFAYNVFDNILGPDNDKWCCVALNLLINFPLTVDSSSWYADNALVVLLVVGGLAIFGAVMAMRGGAVRRPAASPASP